MFLPPPKLIRLTSLDETIRLHATGDWHLGAAGCAEDRLRRAMAVIASEPNSAVILMGDLVDAISTGDKRFDPMSMPADLKVRDLADYGQHLIDLAIDVAAPIADRVIGVIEGNHEAHYRCAHGQNLSARIADSLGEEGAPYLGYSSLFRLILRAPDGERELTIHATHGSGGAQTEGGKINRLLRTMAIAKANLTLMGHVHTYQVARSTALALDHGPPQRLSEVRSYGVITGDYLRTYTEGSSGYGERAGYQPTPIGHPVITITPRTLGISVELLET